MRPEQYILRTQDIVDNYCNAVRELARGYIGTDRPLVGTISPYQTKRSVRQNRYYWAALGDIAEQAEIDGRRFSPDVWHHYYRGLFLGYEDLPDGGKKPLSTSALGTGAFAEYVTKVQAHAAQEFGVIFLDHGMEL